MTFALVSNMSLAAQRRDFLQRFTCVICNQHEAGLLFVEDYDNFTPEQMLEELKEKVVAANFRNMVVTMGGQGAVYADNGGNGGFCPAKKVQVKDTTGAGDAFCAGVAIGMTYGDGMAHACEIGTTLAASVITSSENVCPRFLPAELDLDVVVE